LEAAKTAPTLSPDQIKVVSASFESDPIRTINDFAASYGQSRVNAEFLSNPDFDTFPDISILRELALPVEPFFDPSFSPSIEHSENRSQIQLLMPAIHALFQSNLDKGEVLIVSSESFKKVAASSHLRCALSNIWHTEKFNSDLGRLLYDYSNLSDHVPVNSEFCREAYRSKFGDLVYPNLYDFASLFLTSKQTFPNEEIWIAKSDVHRAYHRFRWTPQGSLSLALRVDDHYVALPITGGFGSNGPPFIYDPIRRFLSWLHSRRMANLGLPPLAATFVDDKGVFGPFRFLETELDAHERAVNSLLGPGAAHRRELSTRLDLIAGARFDTSAQSIGISFKGYLKLIYLFFCVVPPSLSRSTRLDVSLIQSLAGVTVRYGSFVPLLRPTAYVFYSLLRSQSKLISLTRSAISVISLWRSILQLAFTRPTILTTPIWEFYLTGCSSPPFPLLPHRDFSSVYTDATLSDIGLFVDQLGWCHIPVKSFTDSNPPIAILEFIAAILGFIFAIHLQPSPHVHIYIDNQNAGSWSSGKFHTKSNLVVSLVFLNSSLQSFLNVGQTRSYIRSEDNHNADNISRRFFEPYDKLPRFSLTSLILKSLQNYLGEHVPFQFENPPPLLTIPVSDAFSPFCSFSN
jgi:hypothetical protein